MSHAGVQTILFHDFPQTGTAHDLLLDHFNTLVGVTGDRAMDQLRGDFLFFDQNGCRGFESRRQQKRDSHTRR
jgi:hypothetical protein